MWKLAIGVIGFWMLQIKRLLNTGTGDNHKSLSNYSSCPASPLNKELNITPLNCSKMETVSDPNSSKSVEVKPDNAQPTGTLRKPESPGRQHVSLHLKPGGWKEPAVGASGVCMPSSSLGCPSIICSAPQTERCRVPLRECDALKQLQRVQHTTGIHFDKHSMRWKATWYDHSGQRRAKYYPVGMQNTYSHSKGYGVVLRRNQPATISV